jgi:hypothetical protein
MTGPSRPAQAVSSGRKERLRLLFVLISFAAGLLWIVYLCVNSPGTPLQDELAHMFIARDAWYSPSLIFDVWGRTANTLLYMPGSLFGLDGARATAVIFTCLTALVAWRAAKDLGIGTAFLVPLLFWFQRWISEWSYLAITEVPFSLAMVLCVWMGCRDWLVLGSLSAGLLPLIRHEGIALMGLWVLFCLVRRRWWAAGTAFLPMVLYNLASWAVTGFLPARIFFSPQGTGFYGSGDWVHFVPILIGGAGLAVLLLAANALVPIMRSAARVLILGWYITYFLLHTVIYRFGLFESGGYGFFIMPLAPGVAIAAAAGLDFLVTEGKPLLTKWVRREKVVRVCGAVLVILCLAAVAWTGLQTQPRPLEPEAQLLLHASDWLRAQGLDRGPVISTHVWFWHFMNFHVAPGRMPTAPPRLEDLPPGAVIVWDSHYSDRVGIPWGTLVGDAQHYDPILFLAFRQPQQADAPIEIVMWDARYAESLGKSLRDLLMDPQKYDPHLIPAPGSIAVFRKKA